MEVTLTTLVGDVGTFFEGALGWVGNAADTIVEHPILVLAVICVPVAGIAIGYIKRLFSLSA